MEESLKFYQEIVGLKVNRRFKGGPGMEIAFLCEGETEIELICDESIKEVSIGKDISWGFIINSVDETLALLKRKGIQIYSGPFQPNPHIKFFRVFIYNI